MRETAKWLVGGAIASAAGVFTGSTLSNFGHLAVGDFRFWIAVAGLLTGFLGAGLLLESAMKVMTYDAVSYDEIADPKGTDHPERPSKGRPPTEDLLEIQAEIDRLFDSWPYELKSFKQVHHVWEARRWEQQCIRFCWAGSGKTRHPVTEPEAVRRQLHEDPSAIIDAKEEDLRRALDEAVQAAQFFKVRSRFQRLRAHIPWEIGLMVLGFGAFAWAANPPDPPGRPPGVVIHWPSS